MSTETRRDHRYTMFSDLYKKNMYLVTQIITESVDRNGISQLPFRGWKTCRKDIIKRPRIDLQVMKGWRKELGPHCGRRTHSPILTETKMFHKKHSYTTLTKD